MHCLQMTPISIFSPFSEPYENGVPASPLLITPVRQKRYEDYETSIEKLWLQAEKLVQEVERIVIIGYSFPRTDRRAMNLLKRALSKGKGKIEIEIVAPDAEQIASRIGTQSLNKGKSVSLHSGRFEDYIGLLSQQAPKLMMNAAVKSVEVQEWLKRIFLLGQLSMARARK